MDELFARGWEQLVGRLEGPLVLRFLLQPTVATILALKAGLADARALRSPYGWAVFSHPEERTDLIRGGLKDVSKVLVLALLLDVVYQFLVFRWVYPVQALLVAAALAIVPYVLIRGPVTRVAARSKWLVPPASPSER